VDKGEERRLEGFVEAGNIDNEQMQNKYKKKRREETVCIPFSPAQALLLVFSCFLG
jgi:hypothetical protein